MLKTLGTYAIAGRFYNLDHLADAPQLGDSPSVLWEQLHRGLTALHPQLLTRLAAPDQWDGARAELNKHIIGSADWRRSPGAVRLGRLHRRAHLGRNLAADNLYEFHGPGPRRSPVPDEGHPPI